MPSGTGTADVPLPHPFMGKLKDKLAKDVKMGSRKCAVKGSVAKHDDAAHMQLPGTIKFQQNPKKEGEVTGGTSAKVKIDGKEAAVIGSTVTTCNDIGARDNSTVMAAGASMPMPAIINPLNAEEWKREREEAERKEPCQRHRERINKMLTKELREETAGEIQRLQFRRFRATLERV